MQKEEISHRACSACAGDYEDPDRTAWEELPEGQGIEEPWQQQQSFPKEDSGAQPNSSR